MSYEKYLEYNIDNIIDSNSAKLKNNLMFSYNEIRNSSTGGWFSDPMEAKIVYLNKKEPFQGEVIAEIQKKLALVFYYTHPKTIFEKYYINDAEYRNAITSGIYGPKTTLTIMQFQSIFMKNYFKGSWDVKSGFGMVGENTKSRLDELYLKAEKSLKNSNRTYQARTNTILAGTGFY